MHKLLEENGWHGDLPESLFDEPPLPIRARLLRSFHQRATLFLADWFHVDPKNITGFAFRSDEHALRYALKYPSPRSSGAAHLAIAEAVELDSPVP